MNILAARLILTAFLIWQVYMEAGPFTAICLALISLNLEALAKILSSNRDQITRSMHVAAEAADRLADALQISEASRGKDGRDDG